MRYTISEQARIEVFRRPAELNRQHYEEEVAQGLHICYVPVGSMGYAICSMTPKWLLSLDYAGAVPRRRQAACR